MVIVNLDEKGCLLNVINPQKAKKSLTFHYKRTDDATSKRPVSAIFVNSTTVISIHYNKDDISAIFPGRAANEVEVNIG